MNKFLLLFKFLAKNYFGTTVGKKHKVPNLVLAGLFTSPLLVLICMMLGTLTPLAMQNNVFPHVVTVVVLSAQALSFFFAVQGILSTLYLSDDNAFLSSLPIKPTTLYFAKISVVYVNELIIAAYVLLPALLTMSITASISGYYVFPAFYPLILLIILLTPILPLALASVLSMPIMYLSRFFKRRAAIGTVTTLILFAVLFGFYFAIVPQFSDSNSIEGLSENAVSIIVKVANVGYPDKVLIYASLGINSLANFGITAAIYVGLIALITMMTKAFYGKAVAAQLETRSGKSSHKSNFRKNTHIAALLERDFKSLVRYPGLALTSFLNAVIAPVVLIVAFKFSDPEAYSIMLSPEEKENLIVPMIQTGVAFLYSMLLNSATNMSAVLAFSRDGNAYYVMKQLPIKSKEFIAEKILFANIVSAVGIVVLAIIVGAFMETGAVNALLFGLAMMIFTSGINALSVLIDMKRPNLDWKDTSELQMSNILLAIPFLICFVVAVAIVLLACTFAATEPLIGYVGSYAAFWGTVIAISLLVAGIFNVLLFKKGEILYDRMDENKYKTKEKRSFKFKKSGFLK